MTPEAVRHACRPNQVENLGIGKRCKQAACTIEIDVEHGCGLQGVERAAVYQKVIISIPMRGSLPTM